MATETEQLVVSLEARIRDFEKNFAKASKTANDNWSAIESRGERAAKRIQADMGKATEGIAKGFTSLGSTLSGNLGLAGVLSATGFLAFAVKMNSELAKMSSLAKEAELSTDRLQEVLYAARVGGVADMTFSADLRTSLALLDEAQRQANSLSRLFNANGISIRDSNGQLIKFDLLLERASDLIARAPTPQAKARIAEMLGLSRDWVRALDGGPAAFRKMTDEARNAGVVVDAETIQKAKQFERSWEQAVIKFKAGVVSTLSELADDFAKFWQEVFSSIPGATFVRDKMAEWFGSLEDWSIPQLKDAIARSIESGVDPDLTRRLQAELDYRLKQSPLKLTVRPEVEGPKTVIPRDAGERTAFERALYQTQRQIAAVEADTRTIGLNSEAHARAATVAQLEEAAKRANTEAGFQNAAVTDSQRRKINAMADAMAAAAQRQRESQDQFKSFNEVLQFSGGIAVDFIDKLTDGTSKWNDILNSAVGMLKKAVLQAALLGKGPLAGLFGTASSVVGGTGGIFGAIGSFFGGARAGGGPVDPGKAYVVGEKRPELFVPRTPGAIIPNVPMGGNSMAQSNVFNIKVQGNAGTPDQNADLAAKIGQQVQRAAQAMVGKEIRTAMRPGGLLYGRR